MDSIKIWQTVKDGKRYVSTDEDLVCDGCTQTLTKACFMIESYNRRDSSFPSTIKFLCHRCMNTYKPQRPEQEIRNVVMIVSQIPKGTIPYYAKPLEPVWSTGWSAFDLEKITERGSATVDHAPRSTRFPSIEGTQIGKNIIAELEEKDCFCGAEKLSYLDELKNAEILLPDSGVKVNVIEDKTKHDIKPMLEVKA